MLSLLHRVKATQFMKFCLKQQEPIVTLFIEQEGNYLTSGWTEAYTSNIDTKYHPLAIHYRMLGGNKV